MANDSHDHNQIENTKTANMKKKNFFFIRLFVGGMIMMTIDDNDDEGFPLTIPLIRWNEIEKIFLFAFLQIFMIIYVHGSALGFDSK